MATERTGQRVRAYTALTDDLSSVPNIHVRWLTVAYDSSSKGTVKRLHHPYQNKCYVSSHWWSPGWI